MPKDGGTFQLTPAQVLYSDIALEPRSFSIKVYSGGTNVDQYWPGFPMKFGIPTPSVNINDATYVGARDVLISEEGEPAVYEKRPIFAKVQMAQNNLDIEVVVSEDFGATYKVLTTFVNGTDIPKNSRLWDHPGIDEIDPEDPPDPITDPREFLVYRGPNAKPVVRMCTAALGKDTTLDENNQPDPNIQPDFTNPTPTDEHAILGPLFARGIEFGPLVYIDNNEWLVSLTMTSPIVYSTGKPYDPDIFYFGEMPTVKCIINTSQGCSNFTDPLNMTGPEVTIPYKSLIWWEEHRPANQREGRFCYNQHGIPQFHVDSMFDSADPDSFFVPLLEKMTHEHLTAKRRADTTIDPESHFGESNGNIIWNVTVKCELSGCAVKVKANSAIVEGYRIMGPHNTWGYTTNAYGNFGLRQAMNPTQLHAYPNPAHLITDLTCWIQPGSGVEVCTAEAYFQPIPPCPPSFHPTEDAGGGVRYYFWHSNANNQLVSKRIVMGYLGGNVVLSHVKYSVRNPSVHDFTYSQWPTSFDFRTIDWDPLGFYGVYWKSYKNSYEAMVQTKTCKNFFRDAPEDFHVYEYSTNEGQTYEPLLLGGDPVPYVEGTELAYISMGGGCGLFIKDSTPKTLWILRSGTITQIDMDTGVLENTSGNSNNSAHPSVLISAMAEEQFLMEVEYINREETQTVSTLNINASGNYLQINTTTELVVVGDGKLTSIVYLELEQELPSGVVTKERFTTAGSDPVKFSISGDEANKITLQNGFTVPTGVISIVVQYTRNQNAKRLVAMSELFSTKQFVHVSWQTGGDYEAATFEGGTVDPIYDFAYPFVDPQYGTMFLNAHVFPQVSLSGYTGQPYSETVSVTGGMPPFTYSYLFGELPKGLTVSIYGEVGGVIDKADATLKIGNGFSYEYKFTLQATDSLYHSSQQEYSLLVTL